MLKHSAKSWSRPKCNNECGHGESLLYYLAHGDNLMGTKVLLENQCLDINTRHYRGRLALHVAAQSAGSKLVGYLLENGSRATAIDFSDCTALHRAADDNFEALLKQGVY